MKASSRLLILLLACAIDFAGIPVQAQIPISVGSYSQDFNLLGNTATGWTNNVTLPGWYASKAGANNTNYLAGAGTINNGGIYSFGTNGVNANSDRALGSIATGTTTPFAYGVRFSNDTGSAQSNITVSYTGEQWRSGSTATSQSLTFSYQVSSTPITNSFSGIWANFTALNFVSPDASGSSAARDGNVAANRQVFSSVLLAGLVVQAGQELCLRWVDLDDGGNDSGLAIDDLTVSFNTNAPASNSPPTITTQPLSQTMVEGDNVTFNVVASGSEPLSYQWQFHSTNIDNETNDTLTLTSVTTNWEGEFSVTITNAFGSTNSDIAMLAVNPPPPPLTNGLTLVHYNVKGNGTTNWSTNTLQVQAIGRQLMYLNPDIIAFNEIPLTNTWQMTNWVKAFLPGYSLAMNSGSDGFIRSVIASRYPIARSTKWLDGADLKPFGYTNTSTANADNFTRDLFEAEIAVPNFPQHLHVFTTHLKSTSGTTYADASAKRAAEAAAITNFFATNFFVLYPTHPYTLSGDMNDSDTNTLAIQRLLSAQTGLHLTNPTNPFTGSINTYSTTTANPSERIDFIMPCGLLSTNIAGSQVFRTDKLTNPPPPLLTNDDKTASDHLPVVMVFNNPYDKSFRILSIARNNQSVSLAWESVIGQPYRVEASSNLTAWTTFATNLTATGSVSALNTNSAADTRFLRVHRVP